MNHYHSSLTNLSNNMKNNQFFHRVAKYVSKSLTMLSISNGYTPAQAVISQMFNAYWV